jgi:hypothetical protein
VCVSGVGLRLVGGVSTTRAEIWIAAYSGCGWCERGVDLEAIAAACTHLLGSGIYSLPDRQ